jgi:hypothetical protein
MALGKGWLASGTADMKLTQACADEDCRLAWTLGEGNEREQRWLSREQLPGVDLGALQVKYRHEA